jgi:hypothetical protein
MLSGSRATGSRLAPVDLAGTVSADQQHELPAYAALLAHPVRLGNLGQREGLDREREADITIISPGSPRPHPGPGRTDPRVLLPRISGSLVRRRRRPRDARFGLAAAGSPRREFGARTAALRNHGSSRRVAPQRSRPSVATDRRLHGSRRRGGRFGERAGACHRRAVGPPLPLDVPRGGCRCRGREDARGGRAEQHRVRLRRAQECQASAPAGCCARPARSPATSISTSNCMRVTSFSEWPTAS